ncbi:MAG: triose-phosphate isomerase [Phycisphaerales bacterium]|nr:triose-phosphate isomerase [Phycisphaerales bacterium]
MGRRAFVAGNWKMNTDRAGAVALAAAVAEAVAGERPAAEVAVCPPFVYLDAVGQALRARGGAVALGAQDVYDQENGAFTGEVSASMLKDLGVTWVIVGHSERRHVIKEPDELVNRKVRAVLGAGLGCILCVGETIQQREGGMTDAVNAHQVRSGLAGVPAEQVGRLVIAYEPVWAIGTGRTATPADAQDAHRKIRAVLGDLYGPAAAGATRIQYGGSMKPENAAELMKQPDVDGGLIGGAALKADSFMGIVRAGNR